MTFTLTASRFTVHFNARRSTLVVFLGTLSLLVYCLGLVAPYNLSAVGLRPFRDVARLTQGDPLARACFVLTFATLSALYYLLWRTCRASSGEAAPGDSRAAWIALLSSLVVVNFALVWLYPIGAADIFDNILHGRITAIHGGNPFYNLPSDYRTDPFYRYVAWRYAPSAYGPLWELLASGMSRLVGQGFIPNILGFKLLSLLFYAGCVILIVAILQRHAPERTLPGVILFAWNPLVLYETIGNAHNDIAMAFFILLGIYAWSSPPPRLKAGRVWPYLLAALAFTAGALVKFISILLLPLVFAVAWRALPTWRARLTAFCGMTLACAALVVAFYAPFWRGGDPLSLARRQTLFTTSLPALFQAQLEVPLGIEMSQRLVARLALLLFGFAVTFITLRLLRESDWLAPIRAAAYILLFYLLVVCLWFQAWYVIWPLALAALLPEGRLSRTIVLFSYSALWKTVFFDFIFFTTRPLPPTAFREMLLAPLTHGLTWLYTTYAFARSQFSNLQSPNHSVTQ